MHIKKLEITGFKSFLDRTVISFDNDVVGVVGPNGCGKSNIVDAIRWCMGERSAKHLRGKSMEDVIFNGSETRGPHGMAEVTLTFDNSDLEQSSSLPIEYRDYPEIAITRRLYRDGTSEYLINKTQVRLKDVESVFLGTGVGSKAYSIVEQGKIGLIVSARAEDRRAIIEEAAGITRYKANKKAAEQKMALTEQNLLRVSDRVSELDRNVVSLRRQAAKAERYVSYRSELEQLMLHAASHKLLEIISLEKYGKDQRSEAELAAQAAKTDHDVREAELEVARAEELALEQVAETAQNAAFAADNDVRALEAEISRAKDRLAHLSSRFEAAQAEQADLTTKAEALDGERAEIARSLESLEQSEMAAAEASVGEHERLDALRSEERSADARLSEIRNQASQARSQVASAEAKLTGFDRRISEISTRRVKLMGEAESLAAERAHLEGQRAELVARTEALTDERAGADEERGRLDAELAGLREAVLTSERALEAAKTGLERLRARSRALQEMHDRLEGVDDGVKNLMATKDGSLLGLVIDRIEAPAELSLALTGLLGDTLESVVVSDPSRAVELLSDLAAGKKGRATVVPQHPRRVVARTRAELVGAGIVGRLVDSLAFAAEDEELVMSLVGDAVVVETAAAALALAPQAAGRALVALDGTVVHPDGRITGGSEDPVAAGLVEHKREMRELSEECAALEAKVTAEIEAHQRLRDKRGEIGAELDRARQRAHEAEIALVHAQQDLKRSDDRLAVAVRRIDSVSAEAAELERVLDEAVAEKIQAQTVLDEGQALLADAESAGEEATAVAAAWREQVAAQLAVVTERKIALARVKEQVSSARGTVERLARSIGELRGRASRLEQEMLEATEKSGDTSRFLAETNETLGIAVQVAQETQAALAEARRQFDEVRAALGEREIVLKGLRSRMSEASERLTSHELALQKLVIEKDHLLGGVREKFRGLDLHRVVGDYHLLTPPDEQHDARIGELSGLIERMGPVNLDATKEFEEEKTRLEFFTAQRADLEKALGDLRAAIAQMNKESKRLFKDTFDDVNARFRALFPKMFRGGRAELQLTNPEDMLETGIEIVAQPPGKKLGNIELMSGGEKALTAVSLIFALFQHKPSPFCVLDEVDAPLDEANVARYNELIREMTDRSQFIVITHVKRTMQAVDVLYGVTMQEPGISRLVSVKVNESAQRRSVTPAASGQAAVA